MELLIKLLNEISDSYTEKRFAAIGNEKERKEIEAIINKHLPAMNQSLRDSGYTVVNSVGDIAQLINRYAERGIPLKEPGETEVTPDGKQRNPKEGVNVIPIARDLAAYGLLREVGPNTFKFAFQQRKNSPTKVIDKKREALRQLMSKKVSDQEIQYAKTGEVVPAGRLATNLERNRASGERGYKTGMDKSALEYARIQEKLKESDPEWAALPDTTKEVFSTLRQISDPVAAVTIIRKLVSLREMKRKSKDNYTMFVDGIKNSLSSNEKYADVAQQLDSLGIIKEKTLQLNMERIEAIKAALNYVAKDAEEVGITAEQKIKALLPNFSENIKTSIRQRGIESAKNMLVTGRMDTDGKRALNQIMSPLVDQEMFDKILNNPNPTKVQQIVADISRLFRTTDLEQLRSDIQNKEKLRAEYSGDENKKALAQGRAEEFVRLFSI